MLRCRALLASFLAGILLVTLLSPHFGWERAAVHTVPAEHRASALDAQHACDDGTRGMEGAADGGDAHHHGCAGHQFSHTPAQASASLAWVPALTRLRAACPECAGFHSFIPAGPERPPSRAAS
jgi:hypothetical protein